MSGRVGTVKVKVLVPALAGVPDKTPADNASPVLQAPLQEGSVRRSYGAVPPVAANVVEYAVPVLCRPEANAVVHRQPR